MSPHDHADDGRDDAVDYLTGTLESLMSGDAVPTHLIAAHVGLTLTTFEADSLPEPLVADLQLARYHLFARLLATLTDDVHEVRMVPQGDGFGLALVGHDDQMLDPPAECAHLLRTLIEHVLCHPQVDGWREAQARASIAIDGHYAIPVCNLLVGVEIPDCRGALGRALEDIDAALHHGDPDGEVAAIVRGPFDHDDADMCDFVIAHFLRSHTLAHGGHVTALPGPRQIPSPGPGFDPSLN